MFFPAETGKFAPVSAFLEWLEFASFGKLATEKKKQKKLFPATALTEQE